MKPIVILVLYLCAATSGFGQTITLNECIRRGLDNNLSLLNARIDINKGRTSVSQNRARLLPVITGTAQFVDYLKRPVNVTTGTLLGDDFPEDPTWQTIRSMQYNVNAGILLSAPLYNNGIYAAIDVAKTVEQLSMVSYDKAVEDLTMNIAKLYYLAQSSLEQATLAGENISRMQKLCSITDAMYAQGVVLEIDLNRARINLQNLMTQQNQLEALYAQQLNMLRFLLDISPDEPLEVERMSPDIDSVRISAMCNTLPDLRIATLRHKLTERKIAAVKAGYTPTLSLTGYAGALGYQDKFNHFFHGRPSSRNWFGNCYIGLNITIPIFDANSKKLQIRQHRYEAAQAANLAELAHDRATTDYSNALLRLRHNTEAFHTQSNNYRQACDVYKVTEEQYREGIASMTAILQDEMQLRTAQSAQAQAHYQFNLAHLELLRLSGTLTSLTEL